MKNYLIALLFVFIFFVSLTASTAQAAPIQDNTLGTYVDDFSDITGLSARTNTNVNAGALSLTNSGGGFVAPFNTSGTATTTTIQPLRLSNWGTVTVNSTTPEGTSIKIQVTDEGNNLYYDSILPGNTAGFAGSTIDLSNLPVDRNASHGGDNKIGRIRFRIIFTTTDTNVTPTIDSLSFNWTLFSGDVTASPLADTAWPLSDNQDTTGKRQISGNFLNGGYPVLRYDSTMSTTLQSIVRGAEDNLYIMTQGAANYSAPVIFRSFDRNTGFANWTRYINGNYYSNTSMALTANGTIYTSDIFSDVLMAHDATTGAVKWMYAFNGGHGNAHASVGPDGKIYTERFNDNNFTLYAFNPDGSVAWTSNPIPLSSYVIMNNDVTFGLDGKLYLAVSVRTSSSDLARTGEGKLYAINPNDGTTAWSYPTGDIGGRLVPVVAPNGTIFVANEGSASLNKSIYAINPDGTLLWRRDIGTSTDYWESLSLRPDGVLVAIRVNSTYPATGGIIEYMDSADGTLLDTISTNFQNDSDQPIIISDQNNNTVSMGTVYRGMTTIFQYDADRVQKWAYKIESSNNNYIRFVGYYGGTIADETGNIYTTFLNQNLNTTQFVAITPWEVDVVSPAVSENFYPGSVINFEILNTMPAVDPLTGFENKMQIIMDNGQVLPLTYRGVSSEGVSVWKRPVVLPLNTSAGTHSFIIESSASGMTTDVTTHFTSPATGSNNTGLTTSESFVVSPLNPVPTINSVSPDSTSSGGSDLTINITGSNFVPNSVVKWNNTSLATTYVSGTELTAIIPAENISSGTHYITVFNGAPGGGASSIKNFSVNKSSSGGGGGSPKKKIISAPLVPVIIPGCDGRTTGFSIFTGQSCVGNIVTNTTPSLYDFGNTILKLGSRGEAVRELQRFFNEKLDTGLVLDGIFGQRTLFVVKKWQTDHGLVPDGLVGAKTKAKMKTEI